jgi:hypothetical protein
MAKYTQIASDSRLKQLNTLYTNSEADWLTSASDSRCAEVRGTRPLSFVSATALSFTTQQFLCT